MVLSNENIREGTRQMAHGVAGQFYPDTPEHLKRTVDTLLRETVPFQYNGQIKALLVPHAGYIYSGTIAAKGYKLLQGLNQETSWRIIIIGPSHYKPFNGLSVGLYNDYATPLGALTVSSLAEKLMDSGAIFVPQAHENEHSIEVQLPFLRYCLKHVEIVAILIGNIEPEKIALILKPHLDSRTILIVSSDLSHGRPYELANDIDKKLIDWILKNDDASIAQRGEACGLSGIRAMVHLSKEYGWHSECIGYANSGDSYGNKRGVVGYACVGCFS